MAKLICRTRGNSQPNMKPRVYFTCHPDDFYNAFDKICTDIFKTHDCAVYYTVDMNEPFEEQYVDTDLGCMNLFVIPVTFKLLTTQNRAVDFDLAYAKHEHIPILPIMLETGIDALYSRSDRFGELQYLKPYSTDLTEISYNEKLKKYLEAVLISDETAKRVRAAFDAYIFLSYRKKDRRYANELMRIIHAKKEFRDIAIWYDEFLTPGESFNVNIGRMLNSSELFALLVTPNLLEEPGGKPNYVMGYEYPMAKQKGVTIVPTQMVETDRAELESKYGDIPKVIDPHDDEQLKATLLESLGRIARTANDDDPEHTFLIGLAYLDGIDVEVNRTYGINMIIKAAEANFPEAMKMLYELQYSAYESSDFECYNRISSVMQKMADIDPDYYVRSEILRAEQLYSDYNRYEEAIVIFNNLRENFSHVLNKNSEAYLSFEVNQIYLLRVYFNKKEEALKQINILLKKIEHKVLMISGKLYFRRLAMLYYHKGLIEYGIGDYDNCVVSCEKALTLSESGYDHPDKLKSLILVVIGSYNLKKLNFNEAIANFNLSLKMRVDLYGKYNLYVSNSYNNLVKAYYRKANYLNLAIDDTAMNCLSEWKDIVSVLLGEQSLNMAYCYYWESRCYAYRNDKRSAASCAQRALNIDKELNRFTKEEVDEMLTIVKAFQES